MALLSFSSRGHHCLGSRVERLRLPDGVQDSFHLRSLLVDCLGQASHPRLMLIQL